MSDLYSEMISVCKEKNLAMKEYVGLTTQITASKFDDINTLLDVRDEIVQRITELTQRIHTFISEFSKDEQKMLRSIIKGEEYSESEFSEFYDVITAQKKLREAGIAADAKLGEKLNALKDELDEQGNTLAKGTQFIRYVDASAKTELFKGTGLDKKL